MSGGGPSYYGWRIVGVAFVCDFVATGFLFYSYGVLFKALAEEFGGSRLGVGAGLMMVNVVSSAAAPFVGRMADSFRPRRIMLTGAVITSLGFLLLSRIDALWQYYAVLALFIGLGNLGMSSLMTATLVSNWFVARRGLAIGIATVGVSLSGVVMPVTATWLVESVGWRGAYQAFAWGTAILVIPLVARFVVKRPEDIGLQPDGAAPPPPDQAPAPERVWRTRELLRERAFWSLVFSFGAGMFAVSGILTHMVPFMTDHGVAPYRAAAVLSASAACGVAGKFAFGTLADRRDGRVAVWIAVGAQVLGLLGLRFGSDLPVWIASASVFGFGMGGMVPLSATLTGQVFGRLSFGKTMGLLRPFQLPLHAIGVPLGGWIFDSTGSYDLAFQIYFLAYAATAVAIAFLGRPYSRG